LPPKIRVNVLPAELNGGIVVLPFEFYTERLGTRIDPSLKLIQGMDIWQLIGELLRRLQWPEEVPA